MFLDYGLQLRLQLLEASHLVGLALVAAPLECLHLLHDFTCSTLLKILFVETIIILLKSGFLFRVPLLLL